MDNDDSLLEEVDRELVQGDIDASHSQVRMTTGSGHKLGIL